MNAYDETKAKSLAVLKIETLKLSAECLKEMTELLIETEKLAELDKLTVDEIGAVTDRVQAMLDRLGNGLASITHRRQELTKEPEKIQ